MAESKEAFEKVKGLNKVVRQAKRGAYDKATVYEILGAASLVHVGFVSTAAPFPGQPADAATPVVIPMIFGRIGDTVYLHGSVSSRMLKGLSSPAGVPVCLSATVLDGLVMARTVFHHSCNYRSVVLYGNATEVTDDREKLDALEAITNHICPGAGRWEDARLPNSAEMKSTKVVKVPIQSASAKARVGPPHDDKADMNDPHWGSIWAGVVPVRRVYDDPITAPDVPQGVDPPAAVSALSRTLGQR